MWEPTTLLRGHSLVAWGELTYQETATALGATAG